SYIIGEFVWTSMDYLGESGIGAWGVGTPKEASRADQMNRFIKKFVTTTGRTVRVHSREWLARPRVPSLPAIPGTAVTAVILI
ncbi:MAG: hypothetical protein WAM39_09120, partial [Bryobacteraceae bacterium]